MTDDLISRQATLDKFKKTYFDDKTVIRCAELVLGGMPSVQAKQRTGHWVDGHCSECGCDAPAYIVDWKWQKDMDANFCPNCGAKMQ